MMRRLCVVAVGVVTLGSSAIVRADQSTPMVTIEKDGRMCVGFGPRDLPPKPGQLTATCPVNRKDIRTKEGQIVSGFGFYSWTEGTTTRVRVFVMVPAPGAPNRWLNENDDDPKLVRPVELANYTVSRGQSTRLEEMKALGVEPWVMHFGMPPSASKPPAR